MLRARLFWMIAFLPLVFARPAAAEVIGLSAVADAFVVSATSTSNYGGAGTLAVAAPGLPQGEFQSVLRYDTSAAKTQFDTLLGAGLWSVTSLTLQWTAGGGSNPIFNTPAAGHFTLDWMQNDAWVEGAGTPAAPGTTGITFASLPSFLGAGDQTLGTFAFNGASSGTFTYSLSLTSGPLADVAAGSLLSLHASAADALVSYSFNSRSFATAASRPLLIITAVPEPGTGLLVMTGLLGLAYRQKRHERAPRQRRVRTRHDARQDRPRRWMTATTFRNAKRV